MEYIIRTNIQSTVINAAVYNPHQRDLVVTMNGGSKYVYRQVPVDTAISLVTAKSAGSFFSKNIRNKFPCDKG